MKVKYSYLPLKFKGCMEPGHPIYEGFKDLLSSGDYTLGKAVGEFEKRFAELIGAKFAIGVANGTDALRIGLRACGVRPGDEVITAANTFVASAGCVDELFATPRFVDMAPNYVMDASLLEKAITPKTRAIVPVWFAGQAPDMDKVLWVAGKHGLRVVEDSCQAVLAEYKGKCAGTIGDCGAFSLHPLKNLNVWGDGGMITTNDESLYKWIKQYRNHGLRDRDNIDFFGCNSRLDSLQAVVGNYLIQETKETVGKRRENANYYTEKLRMVPGVHLAPETPDSKPCYHLYMFQVAPIWRDSLVKFLNSESIEAKVHYPNPLQNVLNLKGYGKEDYPEAFRQSDAILSVPTDEHVTREQQDYVIAKVWEFMRDKA